MKNTVLVLICGLFIGSVAMAANNPAQEVVIDAIELYSHCDYHAAYEKAAAVVLVGQANETLVLTGGAVMVKALLAVGDREKSEQVKQQLISRYKQMDVAGMLETISLDDTQCAGARR